MRKLVFILSCFLLLSLYGCSRLVPDSANVETLKGWSFQFNEGTNDYSLFFGLLDESGEYMSAEVDVDIRIVGEGGEEVYTGTKSVSEDDFGYYTSKARGEEYLAEVRISMEDVAPGQSADGKVFLTVYKSDILAFDEVECDAILCLPIKDVQVAFDAFPLTLELQDYDGNTESILQITDASYEFEKEYTPELRITIYGEKIYGGSSFAYDSICYKLYDSSGYMVDTGDIFLNTLGEGDRFKDDSVVIYDVMPGESYTFQLSERSW